MLVSSVFFFSLLVCYQLDNLLVQFCKKFFLLISNHFIRDRYSSHRRIYIIVYKNGSRRCKNIQWMIAMMWTGRSFWPDTFKSSQR